MVSCPGADVRRTIEEGRCIGCGACLIACPDEALQEQKGSTSINKQDKPRKRRAYVDEIEVKALGLG